MSVYPYESIPIDWQRQQIDREIMRACTARSDAKGLLHGLGTLAILGTSGTVAYLLFMAQRWGWLALALYLHGSLFAFNPQTHELSHGTMFKSRWLNRLFQRLFGLVHWTGNHVLYRMSHEYHHRYTLHRKSEGEEVHPRSEPTETLLASAIRVIDITGLLVTLYDQVYLLFVPFERNTRRGVWHRYVYANSPRAMQRDLYWTHVSQLAFHVLFAAGAIASGHWFLIVVVTLPQFYGGKWYHQWIHDTMHVGRQPEVDDFRRC